MPYRNDTVLRDSEGVPIPQYFDVVEGVFKPITEIGYPNQNTDILSKLTDQIDKQNQIIMQQQALLDRFNEPIATQVTGSSDEYVVPVKQMEDDSKRVKTLKESNADVPFAEGEVYNLIYNDEKVSRFAKLLVVIRTRDHIRDLKIEVISGTGPRTVVLEKVEFARDFMFSHIFDLSEERLTIRATNNDTDTGIRYQKVVGIK